MLIGVVFIIEEMFHARISLSLVLLLLLRKFVSGSRLKLMNISPIENYQVKPHYLHGFQLLVLLP